MCSLAFKLDKCQELQLIWSSLQNFMAIQSYRARENSAGSDGFYREVFVMFSARNHICTATCLRGVVAHGTHGESQQSWAEFPRFLRRHERIVLVLL